MPKLKYEGTELTPQQKWWNSLQDALDEAGAELDLSKPEDRTRMMAVVVKNDEPSVELSFGSVKLNENLTKEQLLASMSNGLPSSSQLNKIYKFAANGNLFVTTPANAPVFYKARQIKVTEDGYAEVGQDMNHVSDMEVNVMSIVPGRDPKSDEDLKVALANMTETQVKYAKAHFAAHINFFLGYDFKEVVNNFSEITSELHTEGKYRDMPVNEAEPTKYIDQFYPRFQSISKALKGAKEVNLIKEGSPIKSSDVKKLLAGMVLAHKEIQRAETAMEIKRGASFKPLTSEQFDQARDAYMNTEEFRNLAEHFDYGIMKQITEDADNMKGLDELTGKLLAKSLEKDLDENLGLNDSFIQKSPQELTPAEKWWSSLQASFDEAGLELDMSQPECLARFHVLDRIDSTYPNGSPKVEFIPHYATDPQRRPVSYDISKEEILARQNVGIPDRDTLEHIYQAAIDGLLFIRNPVSLRNGEGLQRQVLVGMDGLAAVGHDIEHMTEMDTKSISMVKPPKAPEPVPEINWWVKFKAFFGNAEAKQLIANHPRAVEQYNKDLAKYNTALANWNEIKQMDPQLKKINLNMGQASCEFYQNYDKYLDEKAAQDRYTAIIDDMHMTAQTRHMNPKEKAIAIGNRQMSGRIIDAKGDLKDQLTNYNPEKDGPFPDILKFRLASILYAQQEMTRANEIAANQEIKTYEAPCNSEKDFVDNVRAFMNQDKFKNIISKVNVNDLKLLKHVANDDKAIVDMVNTIVVESLKRNNPGPEVNNVKKEPVKENQVEKASVLS